jgi:hypothetical protein
MEILNGRKVSIQFPNMITRLNLSIVSSIRITHGIAIGKVFGLTRNVMQPWHAELVSVDLQGSSYVGAFKEFINKKTGQSENPYSHQTYGEFGSIENTWKRIVELFLQYQNNLADINYLYTSTPLILSIENDPGQPYNGFIESIDGSESVSKPFIIDYTIKFIGTSSANFNKTSAERQAAEDLTLISTT